MPRIKNKKSGVIHAGDTVYLTLCGIHTPHKGFHSLPGAAITCKACLRLLKANAKMDSNFVELVIKQHHIINNILTDSQLDTRLECGKTIRENNLLFETFTRKYYAKKDQHGA